MLQQKQMDNATHDISDFRNRLRADATLLRYYQYAYIIAQCENDIYVLEIFKDLIDEQPIPDGFLEKYQSLQKKLNTCNAEIENLTQFTEPDKAKPLTTMLWEIWLTANEEDPQNDISEIRKSITAREEELTAELKKPRTNIQIRLLGIERKRFWNSRKLHYSNLLFFYKHKLHALEDFKSWLSFRDDKFLATITEEIEYKKKSLQFCAVMRNIYHNDSSHRFHSIYERIERAIIILDDAREQLLKDQNDNFVSAICEEIRSESKKIISVLEKHDNIAQRLLAMKIEVYGFLFKDVIETGNIYWQILITSMIDCNLLLDWVMELKPNQIKTWLQNTNFVIDWHKVALIFERKISANFEDIANLPEKISEILSFFKMIREILPYSNFNHKNILIFDNELDASVAMPEGNLLHYLIIKKNSIVGLLVQYLIYIGHFVKLEGFPAAVLYYQDVLRNNNLPLNNETINIGIQVIQKHEEVINQLLKISSLKRNAKIEYGSPNWPSLQGAIFSVDYVLVHQLLLAGADLFAQEADNSIKDKSQLKPYDFQTIFPFLDENYQPQKTALHQAIYFRDKWLVHYFLALYSKAELKRLFIAEPTLELAITLRFYGALEWADKIRSEVRHIARTYFIVTQVCKSAQFGWLPFSAVNINSAEEIEKHNEIEFPRELSLLILSLVCDESFLSRNWLCNNLINISSMNFCLRNIWFGLPEEKNRIEKFIEGQENEEGEESDADDEAEVLSEPLEDEISTIDYQHPSEERRLYMEFVFQKTNELIFGEVDNKILAKPKIS